MRRWLPLFLSSIIIIAATGCATTISPGACGGSNSSIARAPKNFGEVLDKNGAETGVYRGADFTNCGEVAFLKTLGIKHILQLNASKSSAATTPRMEDGFEVLPLAFSAFTIGRPNTCTGVRLARAYLSDPAKLPIYVHCSKGRDRTGYVIGMYELTQLARPVNSVLTELHAFGHHGLWTALFGQIDRQLLAGRPGCP